MEWLRGNVWIKRENKNEVLKDKFPFDFSEECTYYWIKDAFERNDKLPSLLMRHWEEIGYVILKVPYLFEHHFC